MSTLQEQYRQMARDAMRETELVRAITWLEDYGSYEGDTGEDGPRVTVRTSFASACHGSKEAYAEMSRYIVQRWPDFVEEALAAARAELAEIYERHGIGSDGT